jgi:hypothetical protein
MDLAALVSAASERRPRPLKAELCLEALKSDGWRPVKVRVEGGYEYIIKGLWRLGWPTHDGLSPARTIFSEQVAGRLGSLMLAPIPEVALIDVPQQLIDQHADVMQHLSGGLAHGSRFIENCVSAQPKHLMHFPVETQNRSRFALLAIFFGWTNGHVGEPIHDAEFLYDRSSNDVYAVDFGNFFGGPICADLTFFSSPATPNAWIVNMCGLTDEELATACERLRVITPEQIAEAVAAPPGEWVLISHQRVELAKRLLERQAELVAMGWRTPSGPRRHEEKRQRVEAALRVFVDRFKLAPEALGRLSYAIYWLYRDHARRKLLDDRERRFSSRFGESVRKLAERTAISPEPDALEHAAHMTRLDTLERRKLGRRKAIEGASTAGWDDLSAGERRRATRRLRERAQYGTKLRQPAPEVGYLRQVVGLLERELGRRLPFSSSPPGMGRPDDYAGRHHGSAFDVIMAAAEMADYRLTNEAMATLIRRLRRSIQKSAETDVSH